LPQEFLGHGKMEHTFSIILGEQQGVL
jgi:hypothetical protein